jgi:hypothetical protein
MGARFNQKSIISFIVSRTRRTKNQFSNSVFITYKELIQSLGDCFCCCCRIKIFKKAHKRAINQKLYVYESNRNENNRILDSIYDGTFFLSHRLLIGH